MACPSAPHTLVRLSLTPAHPHTPRSLLSLSVPAPKSYPPSSVLFLSHLPTLSSCLATSFIYFFPACFCLIPAGLQPYHRCSPFSPLLFIIAQVNSFCLPFIIFCLFLHSFFLLQLLAPFISRMITISCLLHSFEFLFLASLTNLSKMGCYVYGHGSPREFPWRGSCSPVACPGREYL